MLKELFIYMKQVYDVKYKNNLDKLKSIRYEISQKNDYINIGKEILSVSDTNKSKYVL